MSPLGLVHSLFAVVALGAGAFVLLLPKGTRRHRRLGWSYVISMVALNTTALLIYRLSGHFGPFHVAATASLATVGAGAWAAARRRPRDRWLERHYCWMTYSYVGLLAAAVAEVVTRFEFGSFWWVVVLVSTAVIAAGGVAVRRYAARVLMRVKVVPPRSSLSVC